MYGFYGRPPHWDRRAARREWRHKYRQHHPRHARFMARRFIFFFGGVATFFLAALGGIFYLLSRLQYPAGSQNTWVLVVCAFPIVFVLLLTWFGRQAYWRYGSPVDEVMAAADAVAEGDLKVRVSENSPGDLGRLAHSFNRMTDGLERAEEQRRHLTADVAHELRTPLHIIQGNLEGVLDGVYEPTREHIEATLDETRLLARLVNDLQTLSLAEAGQLPLHPIQTSVADLLADVVTGFAGQAAACEVDLRQEYPGGEEGLELFGDPDRLEQVLSNLVANALRHTPQGGYITLRAQRVGEEVHVAVQDSGEGIAPQDLPYIFDRFWKSDRSRTRRSGGGSGLGLAIARQLVQAHGGQIRAESQEGQGTTFFITLPVNGLVGDEEDDRA
ncbi:MAG: HAMP domain-containing sensor histidine kinase [Anaerolineaceae bacterium]|nr:HAMP domain-containing sensor histidine kinase [Anaerolineaceae bacterium]